jgi:cell division protein FtsB
MAVAVTFLVCTAINLRSFSELREETVHNKSLDAEINRLTEENLALQEQIHDLKNDPATIEREARKLGMGRVGEKVLVSMN